MKKYFVVFIVLVLLFSIVTIFNKEDATVKENTINTKEESADSKEENTDSKEKATTIKKNGKYYSKEDVAEYLIIYKKLPTNFITKKEAKKNGWNPSKNKLSDVMEGYCIGGDKFGNREKLLPMKKGRKYYECDIDYKGGKRNAKRIVFSNDGLIFYTNDHYKSFEKLYGEE